MTVLGVAWGTFATVALLSFGTGLEKEMTKRAQGMGRGIMILWPGKTARPWRGLPEGQRLHFDGRDVARLRQEVPGLETVCPETLRREVVARGDAVYRAVIAGVEPSYRGLRQMVPRPGGRFHSERDEREARAVAFLGNRIADQIFPRGSAVGKSVTIGGIRFTVIGTMEPKTQDSDYSGKDDERVCIPASTYRQRFGERFYDNLVMRATPGSHPQDVSGAVTEILARAKTFDPADEGALDWWDTTEGDRVRGYAFLAMKVMTGGAGLLTLLVGGLGVANLMFLRVRARTPEIGLYLALGSTRRRVLGAVLLDGVLLTGAGGTLGVMSALAAGWLVGASPLAASVGQPTVSPWLAIGTVMILVVLGLTAGWFPARRAAAVDPILALGGKP